MSSEKPASERLVEAASELCDQALRKAKGAAGRRSPGAGAIAPGLVAVANEGRSGSADLAREVAGIMLRGAGAVGETVVDVVGQLESAVTGKPRAVSKDVPRAEASATPAGLVLPPTGSGAKVSEPFAVMNRDRVAMDDVRLRCHGLDGPGGRSIPEDSIGFEPSTIAVPARGTVRVACTVAVPDATRPGTYTGSIVAPDHPGVQLHVSLTVE
jgi:hypothetical protein